VRRFESKSGRGISIVTRVLRLVGAPASTQEKPSVAVCFISPDRRPAVPGNLQSRAGWTFDEIGHRSCAIKPAMMGRWSEATPQPGNART
jgi:hypothetical protein